MSVASIKAGEAWVSITAKTDQLERDLLEAASMIDGAANKLSKLNVVVSPQIKIESLQKAARSIDILRNGLDSFAKSSLDFSVSQGKRFLAFAATVGGAAFSFSSMGDQFEKMSHRTGMSAEFLSEYSHVAGLCGTNIEAVDRTAASFRRRLGVSFDRRVADRRAIVSAAAGRSIGSDLF